MFSVRSVVVAATVALASVVGAYSIDPDSVPLGTRQSWCSDELSSCPLICAAIAPGPALVNTCDPESLTYGCLCANNKQPNISEYTLTLPYFICTEFGTQCVNACGQDNQCASSCRQNNTCGAADPKRYNSTSTASTTAGASATSSSADTIFTGNPGSGSNSGSGSSSSTKNAAVSAVDIGRTYGLFVIMGSMFVGFALL